MLFNQRQKIEYAKFAYSSLGKVFDKQTKTIDDQEIKQAIALKRFNKTWTTINWSTFSKKLEEKIKRRNLKHEAAKYKYDFQQYETIRSFGESIYPSKISINNAEMCRTNLLENMVKFNNTSRPKTNEGEK